MAAPIPNTQQQPALAAQTAETATLGEKPSAFKSISKALGGLSTREKVMIWALVIIALIIALVFLLVLPANDRLLAAQSERQALRDEQTTTQLAISTTSTNETLLENSQARYAEYLLKYQAPLLPEDIDRMLTTLIGDCGFTAGSLTLSAATTEGVASYSASAPSWEVPNSSITDENAASAETSSAETSGLDNAVTGISSTDEAVSAAESAASNTAGTNTGTDVSGAQVQVYNVQVSMIGYEDNYYALLDRVLPLSWIKIVSTTYTPPPRYYADYAALEQSCTVYFKIYVNAEATVKSL